MLITVNPQPLVSYPEMATPRVTPEGIVSWGGVAMNAARVYPTVPGMIFETVGMGVFPISSRAPVLRGDIDAWITTGTAGSAFCVGVLYLSATVYIALFLDATNRPSALIKDNTGATVATFTPSGAAFASGVRMHLRLTWNASTPFVGLMRNDEAAAGSWSAVSAWSPFLASDLYVGYAVSPYVAFNGSLENLQLGNQPGV
jgi:hypothetical protein